MKQFVCSLSMAILVFTSAVRPAYAQQLKPFMTGLVSTGNVDFNTTDKGDPDNSIADVAKFSGVLTGVVLNFSWAQLQPHPDSLDWPSIQNALAPIREFNRRHPRYAVKAELRVWSGSESPTWVKDLAGGPVTVMHGNNKVTIPRFWTPEYKEAWKKLQKQLADFYDLQPMIASVTNTFGASTSDDPFLLPTDSISIKNMRGAGFSDAAYERCLSSAGEICTVWKHTPVVYPFSTFNSTDSGRARPKPDVTVRIMKRFRKEFGLHGILSNQALQASPPAEVKRLYAEMKKLGGPIQLQISSPDQHQWGSAIKYGASIGARTIELRPRSGAEGFAFMQRDDLLKLDKLLF